MLVWAAFYLVSLDWTALLSSIDVWNSFFLNLFLLNSYGFEDALKWNYPSWSISAELFAYLLFFVAVSVLRHRLTASVALAISVAAYALLVARSETTIVRTFDLGFIRCVAGFFLGVAAFKLYALRTQQATTHGTIVEISVLALILVILMVPPGFLVAELALVMVFAGAVLLFAGSNGAVSALLQHPLPVYLGQISYSIYMVHGLIVVVISNISAPALDLVPQSMLSIRDPDRVFYVTTFAPVLNLLILLVTIAIAAPAYRLVEQPFRSLSKKLSKRGLLLSQAGRARTAGPDVRLSDLASRD